MGKQLGIYAGSFLPFHVGHKNIFEKAERILGKGNVILAIGHNPAKPLTDSTERATKLQEKLNSPVITYTGFLHDLILSKHDEGYNVVLIRGLRNGDDLAHEDNQLKFINEFLPIDYKLDTMFLMSDEQYKHVSSSAVRQLEMIEEGSGQKYVF